MSFFWAWTISSIVMIGKSRAYSFPVSGLIDAGPVEPLQPPKTLEQMTKYLSVSNAFPGPITISHHPGLASPECQPAAWASPVSAWQTRIALVLAEFNSP